MKLSVTNISLSVLLLTFSLFTHSSEFKVLLEVPRLNVAEYHRPYVALWIAKENKQVEINLNALYDLKLKDEEGEKWLKDMRQWWRRSGRRLDMPVDGVSGATRGPGAHEFNYTNKLSDLKPGQYQLMIEAAREVGGREILEIPFQWPVEKQQSLSVSGESELGKITLQLSP